MLTLSCKVDLDKINAPLRLLYAQENRVVNKSSVPVENRVSLVWDAAIPTNPCVQTLSLQVQSYCCSFQKRNTLRPLLQLWDRNHFHVQTWLFQESVELEGLAISLDSSLPGSTSCIDSCSNG